MPCSNAIGITALAHRVHSMFLPCIEVKLSHALFQLLAKICKHCRVLYGQMHVRSYDWANTQPSSLDGSGPTSSAAKLVLDEVVEPSSAPAVIFPTAGGNIHQFTAVTDCAVLDILAPPYSPRGGKSHA